jgi:predicted PurR-regulated permease PerM
MDEVYFRKITTTVILAVLIVLSLFLLRPILLPIIAGFILTFILSPIYNKIFKIIKSKNLSAILICIFLLALIIIPLWFLTPVIIDESIKLYLASQQLDIITPLEKLLPSLFASEVFAEQARTAIQSFTTNLTSSLMTNLSEFLLDFPSIILNIFIIFLTLFYTIKDKEEIISYIKSLLPFPKDVEKRLFDSTKDITSSVLYGYVIIGLVQGVILGLGFFIFQVPNLFLLTILAIIVGILPILGPSLIGAPVALYLLIKGNTFSALGILIFTLASSFSDYLIRPFLVSKKAKLPTALILVGMIGGFLMFGILGFILGPLIIAYLIIIIELYKKRETPSALIPESK